MVAAPLALAAVERRPALDRDERVLQPRAAQVVRVHVTGRDGRRADRLGEVAERGVPPRVAALVRPLQLDVERAGERLREPGGAVRVDDAEPMPRAARERDETLRVLGDRLDARLGRQQLALPSRQTRARVCVGEDPAEVRVAALLSQSSVMCAPPASVTSAPVIGRTPKCFAACANSSEPQTPSWSVSASAS